MYLDEYLIAIRPDGEFFRVRPSDSPIIPSEWALVKHDSLGRQAYYDYRNRLKPGYWGNRIFNIKKEYGKKTIYLKRVLKRRCSFEHYFQPTKNRIYECYKKHSCIFCTFRIATEEEIAKYKEGKK
jgi:hypothetical protein